MKEQLYLEGTEPPPDPDKNPAIDQALDGWLTAKKRQTHAAEDTKLRHEVLLGLMAEHAIERYPFYDENGRKKYVVADRTPRAKTITAPSKKQEPQEEPVSSRRVSRESVAAEVDPFAATRGAMEGQEEEQTKPRGRRKGGR